MRRVRTGRRMRFPFDLAAYEPLALDPTQKSLQPAQREALARNIGLCCDAVVFFTAVAEAKGLGGATGGPFDIVPEALIAEAFIRAGVPLVPIHFDEAGH